MAKKNTKKPNVNQLSSAQRSLLGRDAANTNDRLPNPESVQITDKVAERTNRKVMQLIGGIAKLRKFQEEHSEGDQAEFFEENEEKISSLVHLNLPETYQKLIVNSDRRTQIYSQMLQRGVMTQPELDNFQLMFLPKASQHQHHP